jgi:hypothetical protein
LFFFLLLLLNYQPTIHFSNTNTQLLFFSQYFLIRRTKSTADSLYSIVQLNSHPTNCAYWNTNTWSKQWWSPC